MALLIESICRYGHLGIPNFLHSLLIIYQYGKKRHMGAPDPAIIKSTFLVKAT